MKILLLAHAYPPHIGGGAEISTALVAEGLTARGHELHVLTCAEQPAEDERNGVRIHRVTSPNIYWSLKAKPTLPQKLGWLLLDNYNPHAGNVMGDALRSVQPDLVITSTLENFGASAWLAARRAGVPVVHFLRNYALMCKNMAMFKNGRNCASRCASCNALTYGKKLASRQINGVIGISEHILKKHQDEGYFRGVPGVVIPNFVPQSTPIRKPHERDPEIPVFGYIGAISEHKGITHLAQSFIQAQKSGPAKLILAGEGNPAYLDKLREMLKGCQVDFTGWVDPSTFYRRIDCMILPSLWHEPFGRVTLEAFAEGVPVFGSRRGGIPETIRDGVDGHLFDPDQPADLAGLMSRYITNPHGLIELAGNISSALEKYSADRVLPQIENFLHLFI